MTFTLTKDDVTPELRRLALAVARPRALLAAGGRAMANFLKRHFRALDASHPNKMGGTRQHVMAQIGRSVQNPVLTDTAVTVAVSDERYAHLVYGGVITAKRFKYLAIPVSVEAYGRRASVLEHELGIKLHPLGHEGRGVLAEKLPGGQIKVHYVLKRSVNQNPFPGAVPNMDEFYGDAMKHVRAAAQRQLNPNGGSVAKN